MPVHIAEKAIEQSSYEISANWVDENGDAVDPDTLAWTLHDGDGRVVNSRSSVAIGAPVANTVILLEGADLAVAGNSAIRRYVLFEGTFTSVVHGAGKPLRDQVSFDILPLVKI